MVLAPKALKMKILHNTQYNKQNTVKFTQMQFSFLFKYKPKEPLNSIHIHCTKVSLLQLASLRACREYYNIHTFRHTDT